MMHTHLHSVCVCVFVILLLCKVQAIQITASICMGARRIRVTLSFFQSLHSRSACHRCLSRLTVINSGLLLRVGSSFFSYSSPDYSQPIRRVIRLTANHHVHLAPVSQASQPVSQFASSHAKRIVGQRHQTNQSAKKKKKKWERWARAIRLLIS